ncbi:Complex I intermediate-associated protein 30 (CIA30) [Flavobacteriaceae bacterium MAR_2010_188]|nr:Complex I intermediate-associated protein 30 (CIA30) [Flavobacteriaceae bacterium MAR_2010_188]
MNTEKTLYDFKKNDSLDHWEIEDDVVMGGKSQGQLSINDEGHAKFTGKVSLENDGGFSQMQSDFDKIDTSKFSKFKIKLKGDGKDYQFRVQEKHDQKHVYKTEFSTSGEWQTVELNFNDLTPSYHGEDLDIPNYSGKLLAHMAILIGNGREESFEMLVDKIWVE